MTICNYCKGLGKYIEKILSKIFWTLAAQATLNIEVIFNILNKIKQGENVMPFWIPRKPYLSKAGDLFTTSEQ